MSNEIVKDLRVETPLGALLARVQGDPDHPGIYIDLRRQDADQDLLLALVEFCEDEGDLPDGKHCIITRVWDEAMQDEYSYRHIHKGIEDYFKTDEDQGSAKAYTVYLSQLQYGNVTVEATSKKEAEEKARALYKQGSVEWHDEELTDLEASEEPAKKPLGEGYHKEAVVEPLILEPEDWSRREWATLCKMCGLPADRAERIVLHVGEMESYIGKEGAKNVLW